MVEIQVKRCTDCETFKPLGDFFAGRSTCKICYNIRIQEYRRNNRAKTNRAKVNISQRNREYIFSYLSRHPCVDCGEDDPIVLEFDHVRGEKKFALSKAPGRNLSLSLIDTEMAKCEVRCANCHRRITAKRGGYYRFRIAS